MPTRIVKLENNTMSMEIKIHHKHGGFTLQTQMRKLALDGFLDITDNILILLI